MLAMNLRALRGVRYPVSSLTPIASRLAPTGDWGAAKIGSALTLDLRVPLKHDGRTEGMPSHSKAPRDEAKPLGSFSDSP